MGQHSMNNTLGHNNTLADSAKPQVMEIVGPAGAGKTTLVQALSRRCKRIQPGVQVSKIRSIPLLVTNTVLFLPTFLRRYRHSRWFTWSETRSMVYLKAWHQVLDRQPSRTDTITVLDHGPIFRLALLREFGPEFTQSRCYQRSWDRMLNQWAAMLDGVIWLDAPDVVLLERIRGRSCQHRVKQRPEKDAYEFLERYRKCYEYIFNRISSSGGPTPQCFNTHEKSVEQMVDEVLATVHSRVDNV